MKRFIRYWICCEWPAQFLFKREVEGTKDNAIADGASSDTKLKQSQISHHTSAYVIGGTIGIAQTETSDAGYTAKKRKLQFYQSQWHSN